MGLGLGSALTLTLMFASSEPVINLLPLLIGVRMSVRVRVRVRASVRAGVGVGVRAGARVRCPS